MIHVEVISVNGQAPDSPMEAAIDGAGGTVGRAPLNALVLADPERTVSRVHAQFLRRSGVVRILARGSNPLLVDGKLLEMGDEIPVLDGSVVEMGSYVIRARLAP